MINRFSISNRIIVKLLKVVRWYYDKHNYEFTSKSIYRPEKYKQQKEERSWKEKYYSTVEGQQSFKRSVEIFKKKHPELYDKT